MLRHELINKEWIVSRSARSVYPAAAVLSLLLIPLLWIAIEDPRMLGPLRSMLRPLVFVGVVGMALTGLGMEYFLFRFDNSRPMKQVFWFCVLFFAPVGPALYCFLVYSRSDVVKRSSAESPHPLLG
jgi:hypothetical protein